MIAKTMVALVPLLLAACAAGPAVPEGKVAGGSTVKVTPLGTHAESSATATARRSSRIRPACVFSRLLRSPVLLALSGRTMELDGRSRCVTAAADGARR